MTFTYRNVDVFRYENGDYLFSVYNKLSRSCFISMLSQKRVLENGKPIEIKAFCCRLSCMCTA